MLIKKGGIMKLKDIMNTNLEFINASASVYDAIEKIVDKRIRSLLVTHIDKDDRFGLITVRDIVYKVIDKGLDIKQTKVGEIASSPLVCINKEEYLDKIIKMMSKANVSRVFICENNKIIGVISLIDILRAYLVSNAKGEDIV